MQSKNKQLSKKVTPKMTTMIILNNSDDDHEGEDSYGGQVIEYGQYH